MADKILKFVGIAPGDLAMRYKDVNGDETEFAPVVALEAGSIGGGGAGGGGPSDVKITTAASELDATRQKMTAALRLLDTSQVAGSQLVAAQGDMSAGMWVNIKNASLAVTGTFWQATQPVSGPLTDTQLRATPVAVNGTVNVGNFPATQPVSLATNTPDVTDRVGRLLGHVTVDNASLAVTGTFFQATQPVSLATNTPDVTDRAARLLGHVTVDNASLAVTGAFFQATQPVSGTVTANQGGAPWSENLTQIAGTALAAKALPANADGQVAIPVYINAQQYATYDVAARNLVTAALTANTAKPVLSIEHSAASTKTVRIRRIMIHALQTTALAGLFDVQITRGTAASSAGTVVTASPRRLSDPAAEVVVKSLPTIVAATVADNIPAGGFGATTALYSPPVLVYDWQEAGETKPYMLIAGSLQSLVINVISTVAHNLTLTISVDLTEE